MKRTIGGASLALATAVAGAALLAPDPASATCRTWVATHNGTNYFYASGSSGTAANKLKYQVQEWMKVKGVEKVRVGKIDTSCGKRFIKYMLPHTHCKARARVCY